MQPDKGGIAIVRRAYREDIDWLRAIAMVAFHFEAPAVFSGFVGVDIFFVISGYLITGIIASEVQDGAFSFAQFYERRIRRLLPALYVMVALTAIPFLTSERAEFFRSAAAVVTFRGVGVCDFQAGAAAGAETVIPGRRGASNPESRDSGFALMRAPE